MQEDSGWLGISMDELTADKAKELKLSDIHGVVVTGVNENSPASKAGLAGGDVITEYNGERVEGALELGRLVRETPPGRTAKLTVWRDGRNRTISVEIGRAQAPLFGGFGGVMPIPRGFDFRTLPPDAQGRRMPGPGPAPFDRRGIAGAPVLGVSVQDLSGQLGNYFGAPEGQGVLITQVRAGSAAEKAGLQAGDVITELDGERVRNTGELQERLRAKQQEKSVMLKTLRRGTESTVTVEIETPQPGANRNRRVPI
jgi:serine protease Do